MDPKIYFSHPINLVKILISLLETTITRSKVGNKLANNTIIVSVLKKSTRLFTDDGFKVTIITSFNVKTFDEYPINVEKCNFETVGIRSVWRCFGTAIDFSRGLNTIASYLKAKVRVN